MRVKWNSKKGTMRKSNSDTSAIYFSKEVTTAILIDASEKFGRGEEFSRFLAKEIVGEIYKNKTTFNEKVGVEILKKIQAELRTKFLHEKASYALISIENKTGNGMLLSTGDCRVGILTNSDEEINWLNNPDNPSEENYRHYITKSFNAKRFHLPFKNNFKLEEENKLIICSDGFWYAHIEKEGNNLEDDASMLTISQSSNIEVSRTSDSENFFIIS